MYFFKEKIFFGRKGTINLKKSNFIRDDKNYVSVLYRLDSMRIFLIGDILYFTFC